VGLPEGRLFAASALLALNIAWDGGGVNKKSLVCSSHAGGVLSIFLNRYPEIRKGLIGESFFNSSKFM